MFLSPGKHEQKLLTVKIKAQFLLATVSSLQSQEMIHIPPNFGYMQFHRFTETDLEYSL